MTKAQFSTIHEKIFLLYQRIYNAKITGTQQYQLNLWYISAGNRDDKCNWVDVMKQCNEWWKEVEHG